MKQRRSIVIGASSGIGAELVRQMANEGWLVAAVARRMDRLQELAAQCGASVRPYEHDVTSFGQIGPLFHQITKDLGGLDAVVYVAGVLERVEFDEFDFQKDKHMIDVNVLGAIAWLNEAASRFQGVGAGSIVAVGSVAGERGRAANPVYNTSKAALATYMEALRNRLHRKGVAVVTIKPGPTDTEMIEGLGLKNAMSVQSVSKKILAKIDKSGEHFMSPVHRLAFFVIRHIPSWIFRKLKL